MYPDANAPGFSVIERTNGEPDASVTLLQGFKQTPTVDELLKLSNDLLDGKIKPTAVPSFTTRVQTATLENRGLSFPVILYLDGKMITVLQSK